MLSPSKQNWACPLSPSTDFSPRELPHCPGERPEVPQGLFLPSFALPCPHPGGSWSLASAQSQPRCQGLSSLRKCQDTPGAQKLSNLTHTAAAAPPEHRGEEVQAPWSPSCSSSLSAGNEWVQLQGSGTAWLGGTGSLCWGTGGIQVLLPGPERRILPQAPVFPQSEPSLWQDQGSQLSLHSTQRAQEVA